MSSTYGENLKLSIFGQSHGSAIGMTLDGIPAGQAVDMDALQAFLNRRAPGQNDWSTPRKEADRPEFLAGILDGYTCGAPIAAVIYNHNTRSGDYDELKFCPRPGHADYTAQIKYGGFQDSAGGGHFSGRLTAPLCIAGGLCKQWLAEMGISVDAYILQIDSVQATPEQALQRPNEAMAEAIADARKEGDSLGGRIGCTVRNLPAGIGEPMFSGLESKLSQILFAIPAVKGLHFGDAQELCRRKGSENNDAFTVIDGNVQTVSNHCGGILGGISNGMPLVFDVAVKPTPSISRQQQSVDLRTGEIVTLSVKGRHDPCIVPRAVPVVEAAAAIAIYDLILGNTQTQRRK